MSDIGLFLFLLIRLPSSRRCGLAETVGLCFCVDSDRATLDFVLGLVCVFVLLLLFVLLKDCNSIVDRSLSTPWFSLSKELEIGRQA